jgi:hypothetical protein
MVFTTREQGSLEPTELTEAGRPRVHQGAPRRGGAGEGKEMIFSSCAFQSLCQSIRCSVVFSCIPILERAARRNLPPSGGSSSITSGIPSLQTILVSAVEFEPPAALEDHCTRF